MMLNPCEDCNAETSSPNGLCETCEQDSRKTKAIINESFKELIIEEAEAIFKIKRQLDFISKYSHKIATEANRNVRGMFICRFNSVEDAKNSTMPQVEFLDEKNWITIGLPDPEDTINTYDPKTEFIIACSIVEKGRSWFRCRVEKFATASKAKTCAVCEKQSKKFCSRCKKINYCSIECQRAHWKTHKLMCQA